MYSGPSRTKQDYNQKQMSMKFTKVNSDQGEKREKGVNTVYPPHRSTMSPTAPYKGVSERGCRMERQGERK